MSKNVPAISIIIPMYNAEEYIAACLQSLLNQTFGDFEVLVVDDCSTDNSAVIVKSFMPAFDGRLILQRTKKNSGLPYFPRNKALGTARGKYVTFLDNDDLLLENAVRDLFDNAELFDADFVLTEKYIELNGERSHEKTYQKGAFVDAPTPFKDSLDKRVTNFVNGRFMWDVWGKLFRRDFSARQ